MPSIEENKSNTLQEAIDPKILDVDQKLYSLIGNIDILDSIKPLNYLEQKSLFFSNLYSREPDFIYKKNTINTFELKRNLYNLPLEQLNNDALYKLYHDTIDSYADKIDQFTSIGDQGFLYNSLRYYGEPSDRDILNAQFILHLPEEDNNTGSTILEAESIRDILNEMIKKEGYECDLTFDDSMIANALVSGTNVRISSHAKMSRTDAMALAHHELGVHLATSLNAQAQLLRILSVGCPVNTTTQEGLAILSEYLSGNLTIKRLKVLALRVMAVKSMMEEYNFRSTFLLLKERYNTSDELAFTITSRVYRGGGFTKDYLYLKGLRLMLNAYEQDPNFINLLVGKTSLDYLPIITQLIDEQLVIPPIFITPAFKAPTESNVVSAFIAHAIR